MPSLWGMVGRGPAGDARHRRGGSPADVPCRLPGGRRRCWVILFAIVALSLLLASTLVAGFVSCLYEPSQKLRLAFAALCVAGVAAAVWCTFFLEYQPSPTLRVVGFPVPVVVFELRNGQWSDYVGGPGLFVDLIVV